MNRTLTTLCVAAAASMTFAGNANDAKAQEVQLAISCGAVGMELELCRDGVRLWEEQTGHSVEIVSTPNSATDRLALYQQLLAAGSTDIDVFQTDVIWPGILGQHFIDLRDHIDDSVLDGMFEALVNNNTTPDGRLVQAPWFTDAGILYYRSDLLEQYDRDVPETWEQLTESAEYIQNAEREAGNDNMWGFVWQGRAYEGLTCDALEWIDSYNGGTVVEADGTISINNDNAIEAIDLAASWVGNITPQGVLNYDEEQSRGVFQSGNAVFMRNWPYAWSLAQSEDSSIRGNVGVAPLPKGGEDGQHTGTLGGWNLAVSRYSDHPEEAADLVAFLVSEEEQKRRAIEGSYNPTIAALYEDEDILEANPFFGELYETFTNAVARPSAVTGDRYNQVSNEFWNAVHATLSGNGDAATNLGRLEQTLERLSRGGNW